MTASHVVGKRGASYKPREILVSLGHLDPVVTVLRDCGAYPENPDESRRSKLLDLALVSLGSDAHLPRVKDALLDSVPYRYQRRVPSEFTGPDDLDPILAAMRAHFASRHGGWAPTMGKNRLVGWVGGVGDDGIVQHNAEDDLRAAAQQDQFEPRDAQPGQGVTVGVLDGGIAVHPWLAGGWTAHYGDVLPDSDTYRSRECRNYLPQQGHATFITGLVLHEAPGATVRVRSVLDKTGKADLWTVANAIVEFGQTGGLDILNLSFACYTEDGEPPLALSTAVGRLDPNIVVVAAAGNHGRSDSGSAGDEDTRMAAWPAALDGVIAVGAMDGGKVASFTPRDADWIDVHEEGVGLVSTYLNGRVEGFDDPFGGWARWSGSSFAAARYSGKIAAAIKVNRRGAAREAADSMRV